MKLFDILKKAGSIALRTVIPISGPIIDTVNSFLPKDKQLPVDVTGDQINRVIDTLPPGQQAQLLSKEYDVEIVEINSWTQIQASLAEADKAGASTRPKVAVMMAEVVSFVIIFFTSILMIAVANNQTDMVGRVTQLWPVILAFIGTPVALLRAYFALRTKEKKNRCSAAMGQPVQPNMLANIISAIRK